MLRPIPPPFLPLGQPPLSSPPGLGAGVVTLRSRLPNCACAGAAASRKAASTAGPVNIFRIILSTLLAPGAAPPCPLSPSALIPLAVIFTHPATFFTPPTSEH